MKKTARTTEPADGRTPGSGPARNPYASHNARLARARIFLFAPVIVIAGASCVSPARNAAREIPVTAAPVEEAWDIAASRQNGGEPLPEWVERYFAGGNRLVEEMPAFADKYVFVSEDEGVSFAALERRGKDFDPERDFAQLAALRVTQRLAALGGAHPDGEFSRYHETAVRAVANAVWSPARVEADFWLLKTYPGDGEAVEAREAFLFLILVTVDREPFRAARDGMLWRPEPGHDSAVMRRIRPVFYDEF